MGTLTYNVKDLYSHPCLLNGQKIPVGCWTRLIFLTGVVTLHASYGWHYFCCLVQPKGPKNTNELLKHSKSNKLR